MIVLVGNTKGGVGKTTLAVQIALYKAMAQPRVWFIDGDRQASGADALGSRGDALTVSRIVDGQQLVHEVGYAGNVEGDVVIDVGGRDTSALRGALTVADLVLVPFLPSTLDLWALEDMKSLCSAAGARRVLAVANGADVYGTADAVAAVERIGLPVAKSVLGRRRAFATATGEGLCVWETPSRHRNKLACQELDRLVKEIWS